MSFTFDAEVVWQYVSPKDEKNEVSRGTRDDTRSRVSASPSSACAHAELRITHKTLDRAEGGHEEARKRRKARTG